MYHVAVVVAITQKDKFEFHVVTVSLYYVLQKIDFNWSYILKNVSLYRILGLFFLWCCVAPTAYVHMAYCVGNVFGREIKLYECCLVSVEFCLY
jgi:hypothetical protein